MTAHLRGSHDFQKVYRKGQRFEGVLMTAFVLPNNLSHNRLGITASRKALGNVVQRNRAKRMLRETFRLRESSLFCLRENYDWVLNAKRKLSSFKVTAAIEEFERLVGKVAKEESRTPRSE